MNSLRDKSSGDELEKEPLDPLFAEDDNAPIPGTPFNARQARILRNVVIIMGLMLVFGFALLFGIIAYRASQPAKPVEKLAPSQTLVPQSGNTQELPRMIETMIPKGAVFLASTIDGNRLVLTLQTPDKGISLLLIDLQSWKIVGKAQLNPRK